MAVKIRFSLTGKKNARQYRIVAVDESKKRDGKVIEYLGYVNRLSKPVKYSVDKQRVSHWLKLGAQMTEPVKKLLSS